jgi:hypothetical protein
VAQFDVAPVNDEQATTWFTKWSSDKPNSNIAIELTPAVLGPQSLEKISNGVFSLALGADKLPPRLTLDEAVWDIPGKEGYRPLVGDLWPFLDAIAAAEGTQLVSGTAAAIRTLVAARMPCTFDESALLRFGVFRQAGDSPRSYVDLLPGTGLAIDSAVSQFVPSASGPPAGINGYIGAGRTVAWLVSTPAGTVVSDPFLAGNTVPAVTPGTGGACDVLDLQSALTARHLRLCYPREIGASSGPGSVDLSSNVALLGADSLADLGKATDAFYNGAALPRGTSGTFMRGRATLTPLLRMTLNGAASQVAVGTTVRQVIEQLTALPRLAGIPTSSSIKVQRIMPQVLLRGGGLATLASVSMGAAPTGAGRDGWDLPLSGGDELKVSQTSMAAASPARRPRAKA